MPRKLFFIVGEPSGDALGAKLIQSLHEQAPGEFEITGIGGPLMAEQGLESLLPMDELCVMGIWEIAMQLPRLYGLIRGVVEEIEAQDPDAVITIDLPDFNFFVGGFLKRREKSRAKIIHYVAPSVWAWRAGRARMVSRFLDGLMCLFPFEPAYFAPHNLRAAYVGHPLIENFPRDLDAGAFREQYKIPADSTIIGLLLGSRLREIKAMGPVLKDTVRMLKERYPNLYVVVPTLPHLEFEVRGMVEDLDCERLIITEHEAKWRALSACDIALAVSGTVGLELAYAGVPHVIAYKMHPLTAAVLRRIIKVKYAHLANILLDEPVIPEFIQQDCTALEIFKGVFKLLKTPEELEKQKQSMLKIRQKLHEGIQGKPSDMAAAFVIEVLNQPAEPREHVGAETQPQQAAAS